MDGHTGGWRIKLFRLISLQCKTEQVPCNDILTRKPGVGLVSSTATLAFCLRGAGRCSWRRLAGLDWGFLEGEVAEPGVDGGELLGGRVSKHHAHAEDAHAVARMDVDHSAGQFAALHAIGDAQTHFRADGNGLERIDIASTRAQLGDLRGNRRTVEQGRLRFREKRKPRIGAPNRE